MPITTDRSGLRALLESDRRWAVYALGDLTPVFFPHCAWYVADGAPALVLLFRAFAPAALFTLGEPNAVAPLLDEMAPVSEVDLAIRPEILPLIRARFQVPDERTMQRMILDPVAFRPVPAQEVVPLGLFELPALQRLYADGEATGENPRAFAPAMLAAGVYVGVWEAGELVAAAGTHLVVPEEGVAAVGNVYTRRDRRGRGLAGRVTSAVTAELIRREIRTIALNVHVDNTAAVRVYERLGYERYCTFIEGYATR
jgi:ribosomal protein S18 acetylase RimI-like enzyme